MRLTQRKAAGFGLLLVWGSVLAAESSSTDKAWRRGSGDPVAGREKADDGRCLECHGSDGNSGDVRIPNHAGQSAGYLAKQLRDFQSGARQHEVMTVMAEDLEEADILDIAAYFAAQPPMRGRDGSGRQSARGLFEHGDKAREIPACAECHGRQGEGGRSREGILYPVIGGQRKVYLRSQLVGWKFGERQNSPNGLMNRIAKNLSDEEIEALADYLSGLQPHD